MSVRCALTPSYSVSILYMPCSVHCVLDAQALLISRFAYSTHDNDLLACHADQRRPRVAVQAARIHLRERGCDKLIPALPYLLVRQHRPGQSALLLSQSHRLTANLPLCSEPLRDPLTAATSCEHSFCKLCILPWVRNKPSCPTCRQPLQESELQPCSRIVRGMLDELQVVCPFKPEGCEWTGKREDWVRHCVPCEKGSQVWTEIHETRLERKRAAQAAKGLLPTKVTARDGARPEPVPSLRRSQTAALSPLGRNNQAIHGPVLRHASLPASTGGSGASALYRSVDGWRRSVPSELIGSSAPASSSDPRCLDPSVSVEECLREGERVYVDELDEDYLSPTDSISHVGAVQNGGERELGLSSYEIAQVDDLLTDRLRTVLAIDEALRR